MITIKVLGDSNGWRAEKATFNPNIRTETADGLLSWGLPNEEFKNYKGVKAWYLTEPLFFSIRRLAQISKSYITSQPADFLHFSRRRSRLHIPMITHYSPLSTSPLPWQEKKDDFLAVVSNFGGDAWWLSRSHLLRNRFITNPRVKLFGSIKEWRQFKPSPLANRSVPGNYKGEWMANTTCLSPSHIDHLSEYKYIVALENSCEHHYLSEKLINVFRAGSIPIYHAHPSVRQLLTGAQWIDPSDHGFSVSATLDAAASANHEEIISRNLQWLQSNHCSMTDGWNIWERLGDYFHWRLNRL